MSEKTAWRTYEDVACHVLNALHHEFGMDEFEGRRQVQGKRSGTWWEIDCKGVRHDTETFLLVECRRYTTSKQKQEHLGGLAYRIMDTGAAGGFIVSPLGLQEGAQKVASSENILHIQLTHDSTPELYIARYLDQIRVGSSESLKLSDSVELKLIKHQD